jgi:hypothetical protein
MTPDFTAGRTLIFDVDAFLFFRVKTPCLLLKCERKAGAMSLLFNMEKTAGS